MENQSDYLRIACPSCQKRLRVPPKAVGQTITCPSCSQKIRVEAPSVPEAPKPADDDDYGFADEAPASKTSPKPKGGNLLDDLDLADFKLEDIPAQKKKVDDFAKAEMEAIAKALKTDEPQEEEFRFSCKVCGTAMYAKVSEVGNMIRCPDCYAQFSIPRPGPRPKPKFSPKITDDDEVAFKEPAAGKSKLEIEERSAASDYLRRAEEEMRKDVKDQTDETYDFDSYGAFEKAFGFLRDPTVWIVGAVPGIFIGITVLLAGFILEQTVNSQYQQAGVVGAAAVLVIFALPFLAGCLASGLAILEAAANKVRRVSQWPFYNMGESMGEMLMLLLVLLLSSVPGGVLGWLAISSGFHSLLTVALPLLSIWFFFPIFLLGALDNNSITQVISGDVVSSMKERPDAWGAMYLWNSLAITLALIYSYTVFGRHWIPTLSVMVLIPFVIYFVFRQIGNLAASIGDLTHLQFDMEDEDEEEAEGDSLVKEVNRGTSKTEMY